MITITPEYYDGCVEWVARSQDLPEFLIGVGDTPKEAFENLLVVHKMFEETKKEDTMNFSTALLYIKDGGKVARKGWNGKDMWVAMVRGRNHDLQKHDIWPKHIRDVAVNNGGKVDI